MSDIVERLRCFSKNTPWAIEDRVVLKEAADEITSLRTERDQLRQYLDAAQCRGEELRAQVAALEVDAGRWRGLRAMVRGERHLGTGHNQGFAFPSRFELPPLSDILRGSVAQHLDAAIDAALAARKGAA